MSHQRSRLSDALDPSQAISDQSQPMEIMETIKFTNKFPTPPSILYCVLQHDVPPTNLNPASSLALLESIDMDLKMPEILLSKKKKLEAEMLEKSSKTPASKNTLRLDSVRAAIKIALKCKLESGYEQQQGFAENMKTLARDMGILNTIKFILPKIPMLLVFF